MIGIDAQKLVAAVIDSGLGEVDICLKAGVGHQTLRKMLGGQMVRFPSIGRICKVLSLNPVEILREVHGEALQAKAESVLVPSQGRSADKPQGEAQRRRATTLRRVHR